MTVKKIHADKEPASVDVQSIKNLVHALTTGLELHQRFHPCLESMANAERKAIEASLDAAIQWLERETKIQSVANKLSGFMGDNRETDSNWCVYDDDDEPAWTDEDMAAARAAWELRNQRAELYPKPVEVS